LKIDRFLAIDKAAIAEKHRAQDASHLRRVAK